MKLPQSLRILLLGSGGREHAFARAIARSPRTGKLFIAPGNAGTALHGINVPVAPSDFAAVKAFVLQQGVDLVVVGPEEPLVRGLSDFFEQEGELNRIPVVGPRSAGARLEGSKEFAKAFMARHAIPTASYASFGRDELERGRRFLETMRAPYVLKADGLAAGKGVVIVEELEEAQREMAEMFAGKFGAAGERVVVEQYLEGIECSVFVATDGRHYKILPVAKDYKRIGEGDTGLNTGGMGAVSPVPFADEVFMAKVEERIVRPTVEGLAREGIVYKGFLFIGLMKVGADPYVIEYNVRMGDPETEAVLPRIESDMVGLLEGIACGSLDAYELRVDGRFAVTVVCVSGGYPGEYEKGVPIEGLDAPSPEDTIVFHAGTRCDAGRTLTASGRVLAVTSLADSIPAAARKSYERIATIHYHGAYHRRDIGRDLLDANPER